MKPRHRLGLDYISLFFLQNFIGHPLLNRLNGHIFSGAILPPMLFDQAVQPLVCNVMFPGKFCLWQKAGFDISLQGIKFILFHD